MFNYSLQLFLEHVGEIKIIYIHDELSLNLLL